MILEEGQSFLQESYIGSLSLFAFVNGFLPYKNLLNKGNP